MGPTPRARALEHFCRKAAEAGSATAMLLMPEPETLDQERPVLASTGREPPAAGAGAPRICDPEGRGGAPSALEAAAPSGCGMTNVAAADPASAAFLQRCSKALALGVGPMARFYVEEAVRRLCPEAPFAMPQARALCEELANQIEDADDRAAFLAATKS